MRLLIYADITKPRIVYTVNFVFRYVLDLDISIISNKKCFCESDEIKLNYSNSVLSTKCLNITPSDLLTENNIHKFEATIKEIEEIPYIQFSDSYSFDPLSNIFFMISRYEEYWIHNEDKHNRFPASESILHQNNLLEFPIVDAWVDWIRRQLNALYDDKTNIPKPIFEYTPTYDIDIARAYLWKGVLRSIGGFSKDIFSLNFGLLRERIAVWGGNKKDPYDVFGELSQYHLKYHLSPIYFWIVGDFGTYDKNPKHTNSNFRNQIKEITDSNFFGIHPSYQSFLNKGSVEKEIDRLKNISAKDVVFNRFHFLRFKLPNSYRMLLQLGITDDFSMAFPDAVGFRAGTAHPFYWYDLEKDEVTDLKIHSFQIMDVSLKNYLGLTPGASYEKSLELLRVVRRYGGNFVTLWHNSSFDNKEWKGWKSFYEKLLMATQEGSNPNS